MIKQNKTISENVYSILVALAFMFGSINLMVNILFPAIAGFGEILIVFILGVEIITLMISRKVIFNSSISAFFFILLWVIISYISFSFSSIVLTLLINYVVWGIGIVIVMMQDYDIRKVINISFYIATFTIIIDLITSARNNYETMTWTYAIFPCIAVCIVHFCYCRFKPGLKQLLYIPGFIMCLIFILNANRGGMISLLTLVYLISIKTISKRTDKLRNKRLLNIVLLIVALVIALFWGQIITGIYYLTRSWNLQISSVQKMYRLFQAENITNNRIELYQYAWNGFLSSPLWGHGVGGFSINHGGWIHNFVLQVLYEGGIILFAVIIIPLVRSVTYFLKKENLSSEDYSLFVLLFCTSIPRLLFSTELWNTQSFWMLLAFGLISIRTEKKRIV